MVSAKLNTCPPKNPSLPVKVTEAGNIIEVQYMSRRNQKQTVQMLTGGKEMLVLSSGEVIPVKHHDTRISNERALRKTFKKLRDRINANVTDVSKIRFATLTYAENMTDPKRLYKDFDRFLKRFRYWCESRGYGKPEYIIVMEPQARGAWHAHVLFFFQQLAPFIPNDMLGRLWGHGFVKVTALDNVDNVGAYLTAYLGDLEISECSSGEAAGKEIKEIDCLDDSGTFQKKRIVKGARLHLYPANFNLFRCSRGIKRPSVELVTQEQAETIVQGLTKTFESTVCLSDPESGFESIINKCYYNKARTYDSTGNFR